MERLIRPLKVHWEIAERPFSWKTAERLFWTVSKSFGDHGDHKDHWKISQESWKTSEIIESSLKDHWKIKQVSWSFSGLALCGMGVLLNDTKLVINLSQMSLLYPVFNLLDRLLEHPPQSIPGVRRPWQGRNPDTGASRGASSTPSPLLTMEGRIVRPSTPTASPALTPGSVSGRGRWGMTTASSAGRITGSSRPRGRQHTPVAHSVM